MSLFASELRLTADSGMARKLHGGLFHPILNNEI